MPDSNEPKMLIGSPRYGLTPEDMEKVGKGLLIAMAGAGMTYLSEFFVQTDFGVWTPTVTAVWAVVVNAARKFLQDQTPT